MLGRAAFFFALALAIVGGCREHPEPGFATTDHFEFRWSKGIDLTPATRARIEQHYVAICRWLDADCDSGTRVRYWLWAADEEVPFCPAGCYNPTSSLIRVHGNPFESYLVTLAAARRLGAGPPLLWSGLATMLSPWPLAVGGTLEYGSWADRALDVRARLVDDEGVLEAANEHLTYADFARSILERHGKESLLDLYGALGRHATNSELEQEFPAIIGTSLDDELTVWRSLPDHDPADIYVYASECALPLLDRDADGAFHVPTELGQVAPLNNPFHGFQAVARLSIPAPSGKNAVVRLEVASDGAGGMTWVALACAGESHPQGEGLAGSPGSPTTLYIDWEPGDFVFHAAALDIVVGDDGQFTLVEDPPTAAILTGWFDRPFGDSCGEMLAPIRLEADSVAGWARLGVAASARGLADNVYSPEYEGRSDLLASFTVAGDGWLQLEDGPHAAFLCKGTCPSDTASCERPLYGEWMPVSNGEMVWLVVEVDPDHHTVRQYIRVGL